MQHVLCMYVCTLCMLVIMDTWVCGCMYVCIMDIYMYGYVYVCVYVCGRSRVNAGSRLVAWV